MRKMKRNAFCMLLLLLLCAFITGCAGEKEAETLTVEVFTDVTDTAPEVKPEVSETVEAVRAEAAESGSSCDDEIYDEASDSLLGGGIGLTLAPLPDADIQIAMLLSGSREDKFGRLGYEALMEIADSRGLEAEVREYVNADNAEGILEELIGAGYDFFFIHENGIAEAMDQAAAAHPEVSFCVMGGSGEVQLGRSNVGIINVLDTGVLLGAAMGSLTSSDTICLVTDGEGTEAETGMRLVNAACELILVSAEAEDWEAQLRSAMEKGADVVASDSLLLQEKLALIAKEKGVYAIGFGIDAYAYAPEAVVLSLIPDYSFLYADMFQRYLDGEYTDSIYHYDLGDGGMKLSDWNGYDEILPEEKVDLMDQNMEMLFSGEAFDF